MYSPKADNVLVSQRNPDHICGRVSPVKAVVWTLPLDGSAPSEEPIPYNDDINLNPTKNQNQRTKISTLLYDGVWSDVNIMDWLAGGVSRSIKRELHLTKYTIYDVKDLIMQINLEKVAPVLADELGHPNFKDTLCICVKHVCKYLKAKGKSLTFEAALGFLGHPVGCPVEAKWLEKPVVEKEFFLTYDDCSSNTSVLSRPERCSRWIAWTKRHDDTITSDWIASMRAKLPPNVPSDCIVVHTHGAEDHPHVQLMGRQWLSVPTSAFMPGEKACSVCLPVSVIDVLDHYLGALCSYMLSIKNVKREGSKVHVSRIVIDPALRESAARFGSTYEGPRRTTIGFILRAAAAFEVTLTLPALLVSYLRWRGKTPLFPFADSANIRRILWDDIANISFIHCACDPVGIFMVLKGLYGPLSLPYFDPPYIRVTRSIENSRFKRGAPKIAFSEDGEPLVVRAGFVYDVYDIIYSMGIKLNKNLVRDLVTYLSNYFTIA